MQKGLSIVSILVFILGVGLVGCRTDQLPGYQIIYTVGNEGLYLHKTASDTTILLAELKGNLIDGSLSFINDSMVMVGYIVPYENWPLRIKNLSSLFDTSTNVDTMAKYQSEFSGKNLMKFEEFLAIDVKQHKQWVDHTIYYNLENDTLKVVTTTFTPAGEILAEKDSSIECRSWSYSGGLIKFCDDQGRFYSESAWVDGLQAFTSQGDVYLREADTTRLLIKSDIGFDPKFGSGYYEPTLSNDGKKVLVRYLPGFLRPGSCIMEVDIATGEKQVVVYGDYRNPLYAPDGQYILLKHQKGELYLMDIETQKLTFVDEVGMFIVK